MRFDWALKLMEALREAWPLQQQLGAATEREGQELGPTAPVANVPRILRLLAGIIEGVPVVQVSAKRSCSVLPSSHPIAF
jgi:hypothetical protein